MACTWRSQPREEGANAVGYVMYAGFPARIYLVSTAMVGTVQEEAIGGKRGRERCKRDRCTQSGTSNPPSVSWVLLALPAPPTRSLLLNLWM